MQLLRQFADARTVEDDVGFDQFDDLEEFEFVAVVDAAGADLGARSSSTDLVQYRRRGPPVHTTIVAPRAAQDRAGSGVSRQR